jgi:hypothetical protein
MTSANTGTPASNEQAGGNLRAITGIGDKTARTLPRLGISNCAELARYLTRHTAEELSESLAEEGVRVSATKIQHEDWLGQARERPGQASLKPATRERGAKAAEDGAKTPKHPANRLDEVRFGVYFRREQGRWKVTTYDERRNGPVEEWGIEPAEWANWILQRMRPQIEAELAIQEVGVGAAQEVGVGAAYEVGVEILGVRHFEVEEYEKLATEVHFEVSGSKKDTTAAAQAPFWIQVQAVDLVSRAACLLASERSELEPEKFTYKWKLEFPTPNVGHYELYTLVLLPPPVARMALHHGFTLKVSP